MNGVGPGPDQVGGIAYLVSAGPAGTLDGFGPGDERHGMSGGLAALLDDIAALAKLAAASIDDVGAAAARASAKAAGVVVDDTAVTPRYVQGLAARRELPIIKAIAQGSLLNKLIIIVAAMALSQWVPWLLTPILMLGGGYLCFEGTEKLYEHIYHRNAVQQMAPAKVGAEHEKAIISGAVRTDFILSAEIMVVSLNEVAAEGFWSRLVILLIVAVVITVLVYGVVGLIVKMDDVGLYLVENGSAVMQRFGRFLVTAMPRLMSLLSGVGVVAMLWVGGHIILVGMDGMGLHAPYGWVHAAEHLVHHLPGVGGLLAWLINTIASAIVGLLVGALVVAVTHLLPRRSQRHGVTGPDPDQTSSDCSPNADHPRSSDTP